MPIIASNAGAQGDFEPVPAGTHVARCYQIVHIGTLTGEYQGKTTLRDTVRITFELPNELREFREGEGEKPMSISAKYTLSLYESATLRQVLESWRGREFTPEELEAFDIEKLLGTPAMVNVLHKTPPGGKAYAYIAGISPLVKGMQAPPQVNPSRSLTYENWDEEFFLSLSEYVRKDMMKTPEYHAMRAKQAGDAFQSVPAARQGVEAEETLDEVPF